MSLDFSLEEVQEVFDINITHNLGDMAEAVGIYEVLWHPDEWGYTHAREIIPILELGLQKLKRDPAKFKRYDADNGWGTYEHFVPFVEEVLAACKKHPDCLIRVSR